MKRLLNRMQLSIQVVYEYSVYVVIWYPTEPFMSLRIEINKLFTSSWKSIVKWSPACPACPEYPVPMAATLFNTCQASHAVYTAQRSNSIVTSQIGFSYGTMVLKVRVGKHGIRGIGVCCRPCFILMDVSLCRFRILPIARPTCLLL